MPWLWAGEPPFNVYKETSLISFQRRLYYEGLNMALIKILYYIFPGYIYTRVY
jgi:hypothetical protein